MRFLSADQIYPVTTPPIKNGIIAVNDDGTIEEIIDPSKSKIEVETENYNGILCPGFVNAHCHLELSHLKGRISSKRGLTGFIEEIVTKRNETPEIIFKQAKTADEEMYKAGIVAVGDISNSDITIDIKKNSKIHYHTFIELFDLFPEKAQQTFNDGVKLIEKFKKINLSASLSPHAPYTVSEKLMRMIGDYAIKSGGILTIHNQETSSENDMFEKGSGELLNQLRKMIPHFAQWKPPGKTSLKYVMDLLPSGILLQLVHNTFTRKSDLADTIDKNIFLCLCVRANMFIENTTPDIEMLYQSGCKLTVGTDSYASNHSLSLFDELKTIQQKFPSIPREEILKWSTLNGAVFLGIDSMYGSFEKGKSPGIVCIDWDTSKIQRIV